MEKEIGKLYDCIMTIRHRLKRMQFEIEYLHSDLNSVTEHVIIIDKLISNSFIEDKLINMVKEYEPEERCPFCLAEIVKLQNAEIFVPRCGHLICFDCMKSCLHCPTCKTKYVPE